jgi:hypothetical protein
VTRDAHLRTLILSCALAAQCAPVPAAEPLGRLFFTPDQRATLDTARSKKTRVNLETEATVEKPPAPPAPEVVTYGGLVRRSDGKATIWLNNQAINEKDVRSGTTLVGRVRPDGSVTVQSPQSGRSVDLKVGQSAELLSGTVQENYTLRGSIAKPEDKPAGKPGTDAGATPPDRDKEARDRQRDMEDALRALQDAADRAGTTPAPPQAGAAPAQAGAPPAQPPQAPVR